MATIDDLATSILELSIDDSIDFVKEVRRKRRIPPVKKVNKQIIKKRPVASIETLISNLSESDVDALIKTLEGGSE
jgi:hypothetical protein